MARQTVQWALALCFAAFTSLSGAAEFKVGFVNTDRILKESALATGAQARLEQEFAGREKALAQAAETLRSTSAAFERDAPTLAESERLKRQRELIAMDQDFQRKRREFQEDLNNRKNDELQKVLNKANAVIRDLAKQGQYDVIFQDVVYINPKHDMTDAVIRGVDASR